MQKEVIIGLSANPYPKPISLLVQTASRFNSLIYIQKDTQRVNIKSIACVLNICLKSGDRVTLVASGDDEDKAVERIETFLTQM